MSGDACHKFPTWTIEINSIAANVNHLMSPLKTNYLSNLVKFSQHAHCVAQMNGTHLVCPHLILPQPNILRNKLPKIIRRSQITCSISIIYLKIITGRDVKMNKHFAGRNKKEALNTRELPMTVVWTNFETFREYLHCLQLKRRERINQTKLMNFPPKFSQCHTRS